MLYFIILVVLSLVLISKMLVKNSIALTLIVIYILWYGFWLCLSTFNFCDLYSVSERAYFYQLLGMTMLTMGFWIPSNTSKYKNANAKNKQIDLRFEETILFRIILLLCLVYTIFVAITYYKLTLTENDIRSLFFEDRESIFGNQFLSLLWTWAGIPFYYFVLLLFCIRLINGKIIDFWSFIYLLFITLFGYIGSGRGNYVYLLQMLILLYIINSKTKCLSSIKKTSIFMSKKILTILAVIILFFGVILGMGYMTSIRQGNVDLTYNNSISGLDSLLKQILIYNNGPFRAFDYAINNNYIGEIGQLYGRGTLAGVDEFIYVLCALFGLKVYVPANVLIGSILQTNSINIGDQLVFNYAYTQSMIFYLDFGVMGIAVISMLFGYFFRKAISYFLSNSNVFSLFLVVFLALASLSSIFAYKLQLVNSCIIILGALYFSRNK